MPKILIIQTAFIGDVVLATALVEKLHAWYPDAQIDFMVRKGNESLLSNHPYLHEVLVWDKKKGKQANLMKMLLRVRGNKYDQVINVQRFTATGILTAFSGAGKRIGFDKNPLSIFFTDKVPHIISRDRPFHEIDRNQMLIAKWTDNHPAMPRLYPSEADFLKVIPYKATPYITISPASVWFTKQFPDEQWISFVKSLPDNLYVYLLGAGSDAGLSETIVKGSGHPRITSLCGQLSFLESAALIRDARMNYVNDSAPLHFASAMNAPVTAVYCSTIPGFGFGPLSDQSFIVETAVALDCRPCGLHGYKACPLGHFNCARTISIDQLSATLHNHSKESSNS